MSTFSQVNGTYQSNNGLVAIEVEDAAAFGGWQFETQYPGFTGQGYYRYVGNNIITAAGRDVLSYKVNLQDSGSYYLTLHTLRNGIAEGRDVEGDQENDLWVRINNGTWTKIVFYGEYGQWSWAGTLSQNHVLSRAVYSLESGANLIEISGRSSNVMINRIHLSKDKANRNVSAPLSPLVTGGTTEPVPLVIDGTSASETLEGGELNDVINGRGGNDDLRGKGGDDSLNGAAGLDTLSGGTGSDLLIGGDGNDILIGSVSGTSGDIDTLTGKRGADTFVLGASNLGGFYIGDGSAGYAIITDFRRFQGDKIGLDTSATNFTLQTNYSFNGTTTNTAIVVGGDLVAIAQNVTLRSSDLIVATV